MIKRKIVSILLIGALTALLFAPSVLAEETDSTTTDDETVETTAPEETDTTTDADPDTDVTTGTDSESEPTANEEETHVTTGSPTRENGRTYRTAMIILDRNGYITARVTDTNGNPVEGILVGLRLGTTLMPGEVTDENGYAAFRYAFPEDDTYIYCYSEQTEIDGIIYEAASASIGRQSAQTTVAAAAVPQKSPVTTTRRQGSTAARTSAKNATAKNTTTEPLTVYTGSGTTGMEESFVVLDLSFDSGILRSFGIEQQVFADYARLLLSQESYAAMIGQNNGTLMLSAATSKNEVTDEQIAAAMQNDTMLSRIDTSNVSRIVMDLSLQLREADSGDLIPVWNIADDSYVIRLPIPHSMRSAQTIAVSAVTADGISEPVLVSVSKDGILRFETTMPVGTIVLLGFKSGVLGTLTSHALRSSLIFLVAGLVCIGVAVFLYIRFVHQPKKSKKKLVDAADEAPEDADSEEDTAATVSEEQPEADEPLGGLDIFAESDRSTSARNPIDIDIDL